MSDSDSEEVQQVTERQLVVYRPPVTDIVPRTWRFGDRAYCHGSFFDLRCLIDYRIVPTPQQTYQEYQLLDNIISIRRTLYNLRRSGYYPGDWDWLVSHIFEYQLFPTPWGPPRPWHTRSWRLTYRQATNPRSWQTEHYRHWYLPYTEFTATPSEQLYQCRHIVGWFDLQEDQQSEEE